MNVGHVSETYWKLLLRVDLRQALGSINASMVTHGRLCLIVDTFFKADGTRPLRPAGHDTTLGRMGEPDGPFH